jgi:hypothetical protein
LKTVSQTIVDGDVEIAVVRLHDAKKGEKVMVLVADDHLDPCAVMA